MSLKLHYVSDHLDRFPANCGMMSEQQGEQFHQQLSWLEKFYNKSTDGLRLLATEISNWLELVISQTET